MRSSATPPRTASSCTASTGATASLLVIDEWPDEQSFHDFFDHMGPQIQPIMEAAGVTAEPRPSSGGRSTRTTTTVGPNNAERPDYPGGQARPKRSGAELPWSH